jgi:hypothetical protein
MYQSPLPTGGADEMQSPEGANTKHKTGTNILLMLHSEEVKKSKILLAESSFF